MRQNDVPVCCTLRLTLRREHPVWGSGTAQLLYGVSQTDSLRAAAKQMGMSYSKAWKIIHEAENGLDIRLLERSVGGAGGGGSQLTKQGERLLSAYVQAENELKIAAEAAFIRYIQPIIQNKEEQQ